MCVCDPQDKKAKSKAWEPPQFQEKRSRSEKAILGALGEFRGILGAALGIRNSILGMRNSILGMASHDLSSTKTTILGATPGAIPGIDGNPHERFSFAPAFSERFLRTGVVPARQHQVLSWFNPNLALIDELGTSGRDALFFIFDKSPEAYQSESVLNCALNVINSLRGSVRRRGWLARQSPRYSRNCLPELCGA